MGLKCCVCGEPWRLDKPLLYHHDQLHCDTFACSRECGECKDWERAVEEGATPCATGADQKPGSAVSDVSHENRGVHATASRSGENPATAETTKPPPSEGYAAMMARLKGGAK